jgi:hypothetical protein
MALKIEDRVRETTTTEGTGAIALGGAVTNFETFSANLSNGDTTYYAIVDNTNNAFEVGLGTYASSGNTLTRTTIIESSNSNNAVSFATGTKDIFITVPGDKIAYLDASGNLVKNGGTISFDLVNDTSPQLGGNLDVNGNDIISASGNANIEVAPHGTGGLVVKGNNTGSENQGKIILNCQNNSHGQAIKSQPHNLSASNTLLLPGGNNIGNTDSTLVSEVGIQTLTNKTLTSPVIDTITGSTITLDSAGDINLDAGGADVTLKDDGTPFGSLTNSSGELVIKSGSTPTTALTFSGANATFAGNLTVSGTTTTVDTTNTTIKDTLLGLNSGATSNSNDCGIIIERGSTGNDALFIWDESADKFALGTTTDNASSTGNLDMTKGTLVADLEGNVTATTISLGGSNLTTTATLSTGISNGNVLVANASVADNDFLRVDGTSIEGRSASELATDIGAATTDDIIALSIALG